MTDRTPAAEMQARPVLTAFFVGLVGVVLAGVPIRDLVPFVIAAAGVGAVAGLLVRGWRPAVGVAIGIGLSLPILVAIQFGTSIGTIINTEDAGELGGYLVLVVLIWLLAAGAGVAGFGAAQLGRRLIG